MRFLVIGILHTMKQMSKITFNSYAWRILLLVASTNINVVRRTEITRNLPIKTDAYWKYKKSIGGNIGTKYLYFVEIKTFLFYFQRNLFRNDYLPIYSLLKSIWLSYKLN